LSLSVRNISALDIQFAKPKLWSIQLVYTLIVYLVINLSGIILITVLPLFTLTIGGNNTIAGLLSTFLTMSALAFRPLFGKMLDNSGRRKVLVLGLSLFALSAIVQVFSTNIYMLLALRLFQGIGLSAYSTALGTILADVVPASRITEGVGYFRISQTISLAVGPTLALSLYDRTGHQLPIILAFIIALISIVFAILIDYERKPKNNPDANNDELSSVRKEITPPQNLVKKSFFERTSIRPCIVLLFIVFAVSSVFSFMPIFAITRNIENIGLFFTFYGISMVLATFFTSKIADRHGHLIVFLPGIAITFMLFITLAFAYELPLVLLAAVFYGAGYGTVQPVLNAIVVKLSPPERRGAANATLYATLDIGFGIGSFVWGAVSQFAGFTIVFLGCAFCIVLSALAYFLFLHRSLVKTDDTIITVHS